MMLETDKSQDLKSASWRPWRGAVQLPSKDHQSRSSLSPKAGKNGRPSAHSQTEGGKLFTLFRPSSDWTRPAPPPRAVCRSQSARSGVNFNSLTDTPTVMFDQLPGPPWLSQADTKLTITLVSRHISLCAGGRARGPQPLLGERHREHAVPLRSSCYTEVHPQVFTSRSPPATMPSFLLSASPTPAEA